MKISILLLALTLALSSNAQADTSTTTTAPDFNQTCSDVLNLASAITAAGQNADPRASQKLSYCQAAEQSEKAASANGMLWKVWAGVAGVCAAECIVSSMGASQYICTGADVAAGVTDAATTKSFMSAMTAITTAGGGILINKAMNPKSEASPDGTTTKKPRNWGACIAAATATMSVFTKKSASTLATQTADQNLVFAAQLGSVTSALPPTQVSASPVGTNVVSAVKTTARVNGGSWSGSLSTAASDTGCASAASSGNTGMVASCASAADPSVPKFVGSPAFNQALKSAAGADLAGFVSHASNDPAAAISAASGLSGSAGSQFSMALASAQRSLRVSTPIPNSSAETTYAHAGGAPAEGGEHEDGIDPSIGQAMAKLMKGLPPGQAEPVDPGKFQFSGKPEIPKEARGPASEDDRAFSLFDRVTYRYYFVGQKLFFDGDPQK